MSVTPTLTTTHDPAQRGRARNRGDELTAQGHPRVIFRRAIERRNLVVAEVTAREIGPVGLEETLDLVCLVAEKAPERFDPYARRWLSRLLEERSLSIAELDVAVAALRALPSPRALAALWAIL